MRLYIIRHADPNYENDTITPTGHIEALKDGLFLDVSDWQKFHICMLLEYLSAQGD